MTKMEKKLYEFFPHPVFQYKLENFDNINNELSNYIYKLKEDNHVSQKLSNINGWQSHFFLLSDQMSAGYKFFLQVQPYIHDVFKSYGWVYSPKKIKCSGMWAIINKKGNFNTEHIHPNSNLSAAYYVKAPKNCGDFKVFTPNAINRDKYPPRETPTELNRVVAQLEVHEGDLLIFPSHLPHSVLPNETDEDRMVVSFNLHIDR